MTARIDEITEQLLITARDSSTGLATALAAHSRSLRHVIAALRAGSLLPGHDNPGDATLQVLTGEVELGASSGSTPVRLQRGDLEVIPRERHYLRAITDTAVIITQRVDQAE